MKTPQKPSSTPESLKEEPNINTTDRKITTIILMIAAAAAIKFCLHEEKPPTTTPSIDDQAIIPYIN